MGGFYTAPVYKLPDYRALHDRGSLTSLYPIGTQVFNSEEAHTLYLVLLVFHSDGARTRKLSNPGTYSRYTPKAL